MKAQNNSCKNSTTTKSKTRTIGFTRNDAMFNFLPKLREGRYNLPLTLKTSS